MDSGIEEKLLTEYMADQYPGCGQDLRETIRETVGFKIHVLSYHRKELGNAILKGMHGEQEQFIKKIFGSKTDD